MTGPLPAPLTSTAQTVDNLTPPGLMVTCSAEPRRPSSRVHPVPLHPLHQTHRRHGDVVVLLPKFQQLGEAGNVQAWVWLRQKCFFI